MKKISFLILSCIILLGCAIPAHKNVNVLNRLKVGMTKEEVISIMKEPHTTRAIKATEVLEYRLIPEHQPLSGGYEYWVVFQNNILESFGKPGDFGTANPY